ncbi:Neutral ceramidase, partial [Oryzias melastigma]
MGDRKCCGISAAKLILSVLLFLVTGACVALIVVLVIRETDTDPEPQSQTYLIGVGRADCTGSAAEIPM